MKKSVLADPRAWVLAATLGVLGAAEASCSLVINPKGTQCSTDGDCARGDAFEGMVCDQATSVCVASASYCFTNAQCIDAAGGRNAVCDQRTHGCLELESTMCPRMLQEPGDLRDDNAVVLSLPWISSWAGVFRGGEDGVELARKDLVDIGNLPGTTKSEGKARPLVWLVCDTDPEQKDENFPTVKQMNHLAGDLNGYTPFMVSQLVGSEVKEQVNLGLPVGMMILGQVQVYPTYAAHPNFKNQFFSVYPRSTDYYAAYAQLISKFETDIQAKLVKDGMPARDIKVAVTVQTDGLEVENIRALKKNLKFNGGKDADANEANKNYAQFTIGDGVTSPSKDPKFSKAMIELAAFDPDIILCGVANGCTELLFRYENMKPEERTPGKAHYLLSEQQISVDFSVVIKTEEDRQRILGLFPQPIVPTDDEKFFRERWKNAEIESDPAGFGYDFYKYAFMMSMAIASVGDEPVTGVNLGKALASRFKRTGKAFRPEPAELALAFQHLQLGPDQTVSFGDFEFDEKQQRIIAKLPVYCLNDKVEDLQRIIPSGWDFDVSKGELAGKFSCW